MDEWTPRWLLWRFARLGLLLYAAILVFYFFSQRSVIYYPSTESETLLVAAAGRAGLEPWRSPGGDLIGWAKRDPAAPVRVAVFHGNAGNALDRTYYVDGFREAAPGWEVFLFEYPGYGARPGKPSESTLVAAAREAVEALLAADTRPLLLVGESLGSGVATAVADAGVAGLFLVTPFYDLAEVASHHFPWLPVRLLLRDRYECARALAGYEGPLAVLLAGRDRVVPTATGKRLFDAYAGPKRLWVQDEADHNSLEIHAGAGWWGEVQQFLLQEFRPGDE